MATWEVAWNMGRGQEVRGREGKQRRDALYLVSPPLSPAGLLQSLCSVVQNHPVGEKSRGAFPPELCPPPDEDTSP